MYHGDKSSTIRFLYNHWQSIKFNLFSQPGVPLSECLRLMAINNCCKIIMHRELNWDSEPLFKVEWSTLPDDVLLLMIKYGPTGTPKAAMLSHDYCAMSATTLRKHAVAVTGNEVSSWASYRWVRPAASSYLWNRVFLGYCKPNVFRTRCAHLRGRSVDTLAFGSRTPTFKNLGHQRQVQISDFAIHRQNLTILCFAVLGKVQRYHVIALSLSPHYHSFPPLTHPAETFSLQ